MLISEQLKPLVVLFLSINIWDNLIWPIVVAAILGLGGLLWKKISTRKKKKLVPIIRLKISKKGHIRPLKDSKFIAKMRLAAKIFENQEKKGIVVKLVPDYNTWGMNKFSKKEDRLKRNEKAKALEKKIEILLQVDHLINSEELINLRSAFDAIVAGKPNFDRTEQYALNYIFLDIYGVEDPHVSFPIDISQEDWEIVKRESNQDSNDLESGLLLDRAIFASVFKSHNDLYCNVLIPGLVNRIYDLYYHHGFDLKTLHWSVLTNYYVGKR